MIEQRNGAQLSHGLYNAAQAKMVAHYKSAAITYCERTGLDPLHEEHRPHPTIFGTQVTIYEWEKHVDELANLNMLMLALLTTQGDRLPPDAINV